ncbi:MAG: porin [Curvibacter lanceolatus]|jgi:predicted porin|uniref:porin n=1 Tax=Curvibacter lanceolatus TaxID=86182 RepID=UPI00036C260D|nr:porin [Curvibacter lanceolatus]MBV5293880.1 porin [Curvibacter lanceolatus]
MKKSLIVLAALAAATGASAQTAPSSSVTLFGTIDVGLARVTGDTLSRTGLSTSGANISRIGFRGTEDLGGGLAAGFWLEGGLDVNTGAGKTSGAFSFNRRATVSLLGSFGEVRVGRDDSATFLNTLIFDPFLTNGVGGTGTFVMNGAPIQISNAVSYFLPANLGGFYGQAQVAFGGQASNSTTPNLGDYRGLRGGYRQGPVHVALATGKLKGASAAADVTANNIAGWYDFGVVKPSFIWASEKTATAKITAFQLGASAPIGASELRASVGRYDTSGNNADWTKVSLGYGYNLSKRTQLYTSYGHISNKAGAQRAINIQGLGAAGTTLGGTSSGYEVGMRHFF